MDFTPFWQIQWHNLCEKLEKNLLRPKKVMENRQTNWTFVADIAKQEVRSGFFFQSIHQLMIFFFLYGAKFTSTVVLERLNNSGEEER